MMRSSPISLAFFSRPHFYLGGVSGRWVSGRSGSRHNAPGVGAFVDSYCLSYGIYLLLGTHNQPIILREVSVPVVYLIKRRVAFEIGYIIGSFLGNFQANSDQLLHDEHLARLIFFEDHGGEGATLRLVLFVEPVALHLVAIGRNNGHNGATGLHLDDIAGRERIIHCATA